MSGATVLGALANTPDVYLHKIDLARDAALLIRLSERAYRAASFLDDRILTPDVKGEWASLANVQQAASTLAQRRPLHFIFHTGHVGSTLLSRLLDESDCVLSLREPLTLRTLADASDVLEQPESLLSPQDFAALERTVLQLWSRGYPNTRAVALKATSSAGRIAGRLLERHGAARAVYMNLTLEPYLATLLAGANSGIDLRGHGPARIRQLRSRIAAPLPHLHALSPGELAAMSWLVETWNQRDAVARCGERVLALDFDELLADVAGGVARVAAHFELPLDVRRLADIARSPALTRYSKSPEFEYSPQLRREVLRQSRRNNAEQIAAGLRWIEQLAAAQPAAAAMLGAAAQKSE